MNNFFGSWRTWPSRIARTWRQSLQFRTVALVLALSGLAIMLIGAYMSVSITSNLFQTRVDQVLSSSENARQAAQQLLEASDASDQAGIRSVFDAAGETIAATSSSRMYALLRVPGQPDAALAPPSSASPALDGIITPELREQVQGNAVNQFWQSVELENSDGEGEPGVIVGAQLNSPAAGKYELYIGYSLAESEQTLRFMQAVGLAGAAGLMLLLGGVTLAVVRWVIEPIRAAAATSRRFAEGDLETRMPERGEDELAVLARSFNGMAGSLQKQIGELAELSVMQQRFVSDVSHELRTPLTTIRLAGDVLAGYEDDFEPAAARTVELLRTQTQRFESLLSDLLEISRYDAGSVELEAEPTNIVSLVTEEVDGMRALGDQRGSDVRVVSPGGHVSVDVDPRRIRRIVSNLLGNAIEHGEGRPIVVTVDSNQDAIAVSVRDYGIGMDETAAGHAFERFWRADPSRVRTLGGTGLGLAISREDADAHGGELDLWSRPGEGSNFRLTLPRVPFGTWAQSPVPLEPDDANGNALDDWTDILPETEGEK